MIDAKERNTNAIAKYILDEIGFIANPEAFIHGVKDRIKEVCGDEQEFDFGSYEYVHHNAYINNKFDYYLNNELTENQKEKLKSYFIDHEKFVIDACSCNRRDLEISFSLNIPNVKNTAIYSIYIEIKFPSFNGKDYSYKADFAEDILDEEITEILIWKSLKG